MRSLPRVGLGTAPLGGLFAPVDQATAAATVEAAVAQGMTLLDTAPLYGYGLAETRVGAALAGVGQDLVLSTKVGRLVAPTPTRDPDDIFTGAPPGRATFDFSEAGIRQSMAASLERLGRDRVDIGLLHDPDDHLEAAMTTGVTGLEALRAGGLVEAIGVGSNSCETLLSVLDAARLDVVLVAGRCTLLDRSAEAELLPRCQAAGVAVVVGGVFNSGVLADPEHGTYDYGTVPPVVRRRLLALRTVAGEHGIPLAAAAVQHPLRNPAVTSIVIGCRSPEEVEANLALLDVAISHEAWAALDAAVPEPS